MLRVLLSTIPLLLLGCSIQMTAKSVATWNDKQASTFLVFDTHKGKNIDSTIISNAIKAELQSKGLTESTSNPDIIIIPNYTTNRTLDKNSEALDRASQSLARMGAATAALSGSDTVMRQALVNQINANAQASPRYTTKREVSIVVIDTNDLLTNKKTTVLWNGVIESDGDATIGEVSPCLVKGLLRDFPLGTGVKTITFSKSSCVEQNK